MGKPFEIELLSIESTFKWALGQDTQKIEERINNSLKKPLVAVGSGGSFSACVYATLLHQQSGGLAKAVTPLELNYSQSVIKDVNLLFISASGKNTDILFGFKKAIESEPLSINSLCMRRESPLSRLSRHYSISRSFEYEIPVGKDGFLATNSLIAFFTILYRAYQCKKIESELSIGPEASFLKSLDNFIKRISPQHTFLTLYGGWGQPVAVDLESKFAEAALANIFISDYRNFGHGRHHWFAKRGKQSAIIAIVTPEEEAIALKTLAVLPSSIPKLILRSKETGPLSSIDLLMKSFYVSNALGKIQGIDPGRPGVPAFGSKLYNLRYTRLLNKSTLSISSEERLAIIRKTGAHTLTELGEEETGRWLKAYRRFMKKLESTKYGALVFDFDGTLCSHDDRLKETLNEEICQALINFLKNGFVIGIVTGRGKSVRKVFQKSIDKKYWPNIIMGYYNGSDVGNLANNELPTTQSEISNSLVVIEQHLQKHFLDAEKVLIETRPSQITVNVKFQKDWAFTRKTILQIIHSLEVSEVDVLESSHSMDIIDTSRASKLNILKECRSRGEELGLSENSLCFGDKGQWPGNDYLLLSTPYALSVDEVSTLQENCWNIASAGIKNTEAILEYLSYLVPYKNHMKFKLK